MKLLVDMGNTRVKWQLRGDSAVVASGVGVLGDAALFTAVAPHASSVRHVAVSTVASESRRALLNDCLESVVSVPASYYWAETQRSGLCNAYSQPEQMGADRWHAMYGAWCRSRGGFVVVDAGSAITVDLVAADGGHLGGYILAGRQMMLRGMAQDAARIDYQESGNTTTSPGVSTTQCVFHGLHWFWRALAERLNAESVDRGLPDVYVTGGDAGELLSQGLVGIESRYLVLEGLAAICCEDASR